MHFGELNPEDVLHEAAFVEAQSESSQSMWAVVAQSQLNNKSTTSTLQSTSKRRLQYTDDLISVL